jgi:transcriptional regulator with XRE-family HTH domain
MSSTKPLAMSQPEVAQFVRELRLLTSLTQEQFAVCLGVTYPTISRWENGRTTPSPLAMEKLQALLQQMHDAPQEPLRKRAKNLSAKYLFN